MSCLLSKIPFCESRPIGRTFHPFIQFLLKKNLLGRVQIQILLLITIVFIPPGVEISLGAPTARFQVSDTIIPANQNTRIQVHLFGEKIPFITRPVSGERIRFLLNGEALGLTLTGGNGLANLTIKPLSRGLHTIQVQLVDSRYRALPAEFLVEAFNLTDPIVLVLTSSLMLEQPTSPIPIPGLGNTLLPPARPHAAEVLTELEKKISFVYFTQGVPLVFEQQKKWFETFAFPDAPLIHVKGGTTGVLQKVKKWKQEGWKRLDVLVTDSWEEAQKLSDEGISSIHIGKREENERDSKIKTTGPISASDWKEVGQILQKKKTR
ncbi:MAG TPA: Ig-like domain-containing protein [Nitrospiria bacterium]